MGNSRQIDCEAIKERLECDDDFLVELWTAFKDEAVKLENVLRLAVESENLHSVELFAHTFKGMSGNIGADNLQALAFELEKAAKSGDSSKVRDIYPELVETIQLVIDEIDNLI